MSLSQKDFALGKQSAAAESAVLLALAFFLTFMHELGHAVVISRYHRKVKSAGFMIYFGSPAFFVEATDSLMLDRRQRILQSSAGPFTELVIAGVAGARRLPLPRGPARRPAVQVRAPELPRDLPEPDPAAGARRLLDPLGPDPGSRPAAPFAPVRPTRPLAQASRAGAAHAAGVGSRRIRGCRDRVHDLLLHHGLHLLAGDLRRARSRACGRGTSARRSSSSCSLRSSRVP